MDAILEAKNERTASLYLAGLLDTDQHRRLEADRDHFEASEVLILPMARVQLHLSPLRVRDGAHDRTPAQAIAD